MCFAHIILETDSNAIAAYERIVISERSDKSLGRLGAGMSKRDEEFEVNVRRLAPDWRLECLGLLSLQEIRP